MPHIYSFQYMKIAIWEAFHEHKTDTRMLWHRKTCTLYHGSAFVFSCKCTMIPSSETCSLSLNNTVKATIFVWALLMWKGVDVIECWKWLVTWGSTGDWLEQSVVTWLKSGMLLSGLKFPSGLHCHYQCSYYSMHA